MAFVDRGADGALERGLPGLHHRHERVAHRPGPVVELDRAADVDAAGVDLDRDAPQPALEQRAQARQPARRSAAPGGRPRPRTRVVLAHDRDLQLLARAEMGEHARLAHARHLGQPADRQALEADLRGERQRRIENGGARLLPFQERPRRRGIGRRRGRRRGERGRMQGIGVKRSEAENRTIVLFCRKSLGAPVSRRADRGD